MHQQGNARVRQQVVGLARCGVGRHDDGWVRVVGSRGEVCVGHEGDMGSEVVTCCQMELIEAIVSGIVMVQRSAVGIRSENSSGMRPPPTAARWPRADGWSWPKPRKRAEDCSQP